MVVPTAHTTQQNYLIGLFPKMSFSLVMMLMSITQSLYDSSQQAFHHGHSSYIYIYIYMSHISHLWENLQAYNIEGTVQQEKEHKKQGACQALGIV